MSSRVITLAGFAVIVGAMVALAIASARTPSLIPLPRVLERATRSRTGRLLFVLVWAWLGWHLFARGSGAFE